MKTANGPTNSPAMTETGALQIVYPELRAYFACVCAYEVKGE